MLPFVFWKRVEFAHMTGRTGVIVSLSLFLCLLTIFVASPVRTSYDSRWSLHTAMSIVRGHSGDLSEYIAGAKPGQRYQFEYVNGTPRTIYPIGAPLLAVPAVAAADWLIPGFEDELRAGVPLGFEAAVASFYGAAACVIFFWLIFDQFRSASIALATTVIFALGTSMWSTATRGLWQHGPLALMLVAAMLLLSLARRRPALIQYASLPLALAYLMRPTAIIPIAAITAFVLVRYRPWFVRYIAWAMLVAVPWIVFNYYVYGAPLPTYYQGSWWPKPLGFWETLLGSLISPSRGLFVFSPVLIFAATGLFLALRDPEQRPLHLAYGIAILGQLILLGRFPYWWGGHSFGPRLLSDIVPFLVYFIAFNFRLPARFGNATQVAVSTCIAILAIVSVLIHAQGALRTEPWMWNVSPNNIDQNVSRVWDWSDMQFMRTRNR
ncbi:MAG: hypothetical protein R3D62_05095 [Xanthobacteraceae bacterium]